MLLAGSYMALPTAETELHKSFNDFARDNGFVFLRYNQFEIVSKEYTTVSNTSSTIFRLKSVQRVKRRRLPILFWR